MHLVCCCSLPVWRRSLLKKGTPRDLFWPALDLPLGGSGRKITTLVRDHEYFIPAKFHQNPLSGSGEFEEVENVKSLRTDAGRTPGAGRRTDDGRRTTDGRTDDGRCAMTIAHSSLWLEPLAQFAACFRRQNSKFARQKNINKLKFHFNDSASH